MLQFLNFPKGISVIYGPAASGKSTLCLQVVAATPGKIVYIDTENSFSVERIQKMNNKIVELEKAKKIARYLRKKGIFVINAYIFGHPTETAEELKQTIKFIKEIPADENLIQLYRPMPGTPYFQMCVEKGKLKVPDKLEGWSGFGVLGHDTNVSEIPDSALFKEFYKINAMQQELAAVQASKFFKIRVVYHKIRRWVLSDKKQ